MDPYNPLKVRTVFNMIIQSLSRQAALIGQPRKSRARVSDWPISIHNWVYIFLSVELSIYVLTFYTLNSVIR